MKLDTGFVTRADGSQVRQQAIVGNLRNPYTGGRYPYATKETWKSPAYLTYTSKTFEAFWDCKGCGATKLLGKTHRCCPQCGLPQDAKDRYKPAPHERVYVQNHAYWGVDQICSQCEAPNAAACLFCFYCGLDLNQSKDVTLQPTTDKRVGTARPATANLSEQEAMRIRGMAPPAAAAAIPVASAQPVAYQQSNPAAARLFGPLHTPAPSAPAYHVGQVGPSPPAYQERADSESQWAEDRPLIAPKAGRRRAVVARAGQADVRKIVPMIAAGTCCFLLVLLFVFVGTPVKAEVTVTQAQVQGKLDGTWCDCRGGRTCGSVPRDAYGVSDAGLRAHGTVTVADGEVCGQECHQECHEGDCHDIDNGDGTYTETCANICNNVCSNECHATSHQEPVFERWCSYTRDVCAVVFLHDTGKTDMCEYSKASCGSYELRSHYSGEKGRISGSLDCSSVHRA